MAFAQVVSQPVPGVAVTEQALNFSPAAYVGPNDAKAQKLFAKAEKESEDHKDALALADFRKADQQDGGHCIPCELRAYNAARQIDDYNTAHEQAMLLLSHVTTPGDQAEAHDLAGEVSLAQGGYRMDEKPFQDARAEFDLAVQLDPHKSNYLYDDGLALAHLHQYDKARERFQQTLKLTAPGSLQFKRATLFSAQPELARKRIAPNFHVTALDGRQIAMESLAGKVVLIDFWATWCGPCMRALPHLREIAKEFEGQPLVVISISLDLDEANWKNFVAHNGMTWLQYRDGSFDGPMATAFRVKAVPTTFSIDSDGFVQDRQVGDGQIEARLKELIARVVQADNHQTTSATAGGTP
jgi:thiol-disulfide isomerase/thioredoxin